MENLEKEGYKCAVAYGWEHAMDILTKYFKGILNEKST